MAIGGNLWVSPSVISICSGQIVVCDEATWGIWPGSPTQWCTIWRKARFTPRSVASLQVCMCLWTHGLISVWKKAVTTTNHTKLAYGFHNAAVVCLHVELPEDYRGRWETFVDQTLSETNRKNTIDLVNPNSCRSVELRTCFSLHTHSEF